MIRFSYYIIDFTKKKKVQKRKVYVFSKVTFLLLSVIIFDGTNVWCVFVFRPDFVLVD